MWQRFKQSIRNFMAGRHGSDLLSIDLLKFGFAFFVLSIILSLINNPVTAIIGSLFSYITFGCYIYSLVRTLSRNHEKRDEQNRRYLAWKSQNQKKFRQAKNRMSNQKEYKYFRCPNCKTWIRLPRGKGIVTVTCRQCKTSFTQKS